MHKSIILLLVFWAGNLVAEEEPPAFTENLLNREWILGSVECPKGCSPLLQRVLSSQRGQVIDFSGKHTWISGTAEPCDQVLTIQDRVFLADDLLQEINLGQPHEQPLNNEELGLTNAQHLVMDVTCASAGGIKSTHRFIQRNPGQLIMIDEEASILVYE